MLSSKVSTKIVKGESRGKQKTLFYVFDYAKPHLIFVPTNIQKLSKQTQS